MDNLQATIQESLYTKQITPQETLIIGLSGGRDSVCLAFCLKALSKDMGFHLEAVHVNHHLRKNADRDEAFCRELSEKWDIPLKVLHGDAESLALEKHLSLEDAARRVRYGCFLQALGGRENTYIVLAHHAVDQAETVLLHLLRGTGLKGLTGMSAVSMAEGVPVLRPMLEADDDMIRACVEENALVYVEDETNQDLSYTRNRIRHEVLPVLKTINPSAVKTLDRTAQILQEDEECLSKMAKNAYRETEEGCLLLSCLTGEKAIDIRILQLWLKQLGAEKDIERVHLLDLLDLAAGRNGRSLMLPHGLTVQKSYDILNTIPVKSGQDATDANDAAANDAANADDANGQVRSGAKDSNTDIEAERTVLSIEEVAARFPSGIPDLPAEKYFDLEKISGQAAWRRRAAGDYLLIKNGKQKLKDLLINEKVPRPLRDAIPVLADESHVLWVLGMRISEDVKVTQMTQKVLCIKVRQEAIQSL